MSMVKKKQNECIQTSLGASEWFRLELILWKSWYLKSGLKKHNLKGFLKEILKTGVRAVLAGWLVGTIFSLCGLMSVK